MNLTDYTTVFMTAKLTVNLTDNTTVFMTAKLTVNLTGILTVKSTSSYTAKHHAVNKISKMPFHPTQAQLLTRYINHTNKAIAQ